MKIQSQARIVSVNTNSETVCASAARISTTKGNAFDIIDSTYAGEQNAALIQKVLRSGHETIIEHAIFTIAFCNVSAFVEQFLIECRLASFTVKSRRYVDFGDLGYYVPEELDDGQRKQYCEYMESLYDGYRSLLEKGIPKEDARFLLPYSFYSNLYCTLNARELVSILVAIRHGQGKEILELQNLASQLEEQLQERFPVILSEIEKRNRLIYLPKSQTPQVLEEVEFVREHDAGKVQLVESPNDPKAILKIAQRISCGVDDIIFDIKEILSMRRPRQLEQLSYSFVISDLTLSGITHIVRHRMQSIIVPPIKTVNHSKVILPTTIENNREAFSCYSNTLAKVNSLMLQLFKDIGLSKYHYYFTLSGNLADIMTTINAREIMHFIRLRACQRAQWEIRDVSMKMLTILRNQFPELFNHIGPACYMDGKCPEGRLSCGKKDEVLFRFST